MIQLHKRLGQTLLIASAVSFLAFPAQAEDSDVTEIEGFERTGESENCLSLAAIRSMEAIDEKTILLRVGSSWYVNDLDHQCNGADRPGTYLQYSTSIGQLCRNDILHVFDTGGFRLGACGLNEFERLEPVEKE